MMPNKKQIERMEFGKLSVKVLINSKKQLSSFIFEAKIQTKIKTKTIQDKMVAPPIFKILHFRF
jgi:hypothetical protein